MSRPAELLLGRTARRGWRQVRNRIWAPQQPGEGAAPAEGAFRTLLDQPRWIEPWFLYDARGTRLFEEICELPEYYLTRTEEDLLRRHASQILEQTSVEGLVELGAGVSRKTMHLLEALERQKAGFLYLPVDVSLEALEASREAVLRRFPKALFLGLCSRYEMALKSLEGGGPLLFAFLGSTLGNLDQTACIEFFEVLSGAMSDGDFLLLGVDRVKDVSLLERAYNDSQGVTARFIVNAFENLNRLCGTNFDSSHLRYRGRYNARWQRMEMWVETEREQQICFGPQGPGFRWQREEPVLVEISRKFDARRLERQLGRFQLEPLSDFSDSREWFSLLLLQKRGEPGGRA